MKSRTSNRELRKVMGSEYQIPSLTGTKVSLRPMEPEEAALAHRWFLASDPVTQTCRPPVLRSAEEVRSSRPTDGVQKMTLGIISFETDELVGQIRCFGLNPRNRSVEIGYLIAPDQRGRGYGRDGVATLLNHLFEELGLNKAYAQTASFNEPSIRLLESLGFTRDGVLREHHQHQGILHDDYIYSLLDREWRERRGARS